MTYRCKGLFIPNVCVFFNIKLWCLSLCVNDRKRKVMFSEASVSHSTHRQGGLPLGGGVCLQGLCIWGSSSILVCLPGGLHPQAGLPMRGGGLPTGGLHPRGLHPGVLCLLGGSVSQGVCLWRSCIQGFCLQVGNLNPWGSRVYILL